MNRFVSFLVAMWMACAAPQAMAWHSGMVYDVTWGASVPLLDSSGGSTILPIGFVHLPLSGGYVFITEQLVHGSPRLVVTRFLANGALDTHWKDPSVDPYIVLGSSVLALPAPDRDASGLPKARVAIEVFGSSEHIHLAELIGGGTSLRMSRFDPAFDTFESAVVSAGSMSSGFDEIDGITAGAQVGSSGMGAVVAVRGRGLDASSAQFFGAAGATLTISGLASYGASGFRVNALRTRSDGNVDAVGSQGKQALYLLVRTAAPSNIDYETYFDLKCPDGTAATTSAIDAMVLAPPALSDADVLVLGRADCAVGRVSMIERVSNIRFRGEVAAKDYSMLDLDSNCTDSVSDTACVASYLVATGDASNRAVALTPALSLAHVDANANKATFLGDETNSSAAGYTTLAPTTNFGASLEYPYLVGMSFDAAMAPGIHRIVVDRIFADGDR